MRVPRCGGAIPESCGDAALYVDPFDREGWTLALIRVEADAGLRESLIERGARRGRSYIWQNSARQLLKQAAEEEGAFGMFEEVESVRPNAELS